MKRGFTARDNNAVPLLTGVGSDGKTLALQLDPTGAATGQAGVMVPALPPILTKFVNVSAVAVDVEATVWDPAAAKKFRLQKLHLVGSVDGDYVFKDGTGLATILTVPMKAAVPVTLDLGHGILSGAADRLLTCTGPALSVLSGTLMGREE